MAAELSSPEGRLNESMVAQLTSFRELDQQAGLPKGRAFRVFRRLDPPPRDDVDFLLLSPERHGQILERLRREQRIYASSIRIVLVNAATARRIAEQLAREQA